jgi:hypothetical protein
MNDTRPMHYALGPGDRRRPIEIDPRDPGVFLRACAALDRLALRRRSTDTRPETRNGNR